MRDTLYKDILILLTPVILLGIYIAYTYINDDSASYQCTNYKVTTLSIDNSKIIYIGNTVYLIDLDTDTKFKLKNCTKLDKD